MREIKLRLPEAEVAVIDAQAAATKTTRAQFIRERITNPCAAVSTLAPRDYHALVAAAVIELRGNVPRHLVEYLVAYVINRLDHHSRQAGSSHQSA